jgi:hypothetical protein
MALKPVEFAGLPLLEGDALHWCPPRTQTPGPVSE